jgi:hypothetical protein
VQRTVPASSRSATFGGLLEDCHQRYKFSVVALTTGGLDAAGGFSKPAFSLDFRPSGYVARGKEPPYVVILIDGIAEAQPGFTMDPYQPTVQNPQSYCPESWNSSASTEGEADFWGPSNRGGKQSGPWSFFHKWNFGEVDSNGYATGNDESAPRAVPGNPQGITPGTYTHSFMLDALAAQGAIILPFSYNGATLQPGSPDPTFVFPAYSVPDSTPGLGLFSINLEAAFLDREVKSITAIWPDALIEVLGHSQGGLIAFTWWHTYALPRYFDAGFSLDSPINGTCVSIACLHPPSYPKYDDRETNDPKWLATDVKQGYSFHFIGTYGDPASLGGLPLFGAGVETLQHMLLFHYSNTLTPDVINQLCGNPSNEGGCPAPPPDHISECPITSASPNWEKDAGHYVEKFCPGDVEYFNNTLGLQYWPHPPPHVTPPSTPPSPTPGYSTPQNAVDGFYQSELAGNWSAVCSYVVPSAQSVCLAGTSGQGAATGSITVDSAVIQGTEALVGVTGHICAPSTPCVANTDPSLGMPSSASEFPALYQAAVTSGSSGGGTYMSPMPCTQVGGKWYVAFG